MAKTASPNDPDLVVMRSLARFERVVDVLLVPVLAVRTLDAPMSRRVGKRAHSCVESADEIEDHGIDDTPPCGCAAFDRRAELWAVGDLCLKHGLTKQQLADLAQIVLLKTRERVDLTIVRGAMYDLFAGVFAAKLKRTGKDDDGDAPNEAPPRVPEHLAQFAT